MRILIDSLTMWHLIKRCGLLSYIHIFQFDTTRRWKSKTTKLHEQSRSITCYVIDEVIIAYNLISLAPKRDDWATRRDSRQWRCRIFINGFLLIFSYITRLRHVYISYTYVRIQYYKYVHKLFDILTTYFSDSRLKWNLNSLKSNR